MDSRLLTAQRTLISILVFVAVYGLVASELLNKAQHWKDTLDK